MTKGMSPLIATVFVILISFTAIGLVLTVGNPTIQKAYDSSKLNEALQNLRVIDNAIREVASEGINSFRSPQIKISSGSLYVNEIAGTVEFFDTIKSGLIEPGSFTEDGNIFAIGGGNARAYNNSTSIFMENEILNVTLPLLGTQSSYVSINTSSAISSIKLIKSGDTIIPEDTSIIIENVTNTSWGIGYTQIVKKQDRLPVAQTLMHVQSNLSSAVYEVLYSLPAGADFLIIDVKNVTNNQTTMNFAMKLGANMDDFVNISNATEGNVTSFAFACRNSSSAISTYICSFDNGTDFAQSHFTGLIYAGDRTNFIQSCFSNYSNSNYKINISFTNDGRILLPFSNGTCKAIDDRMYVISKQQVPSRSFNTSYSSGGGVEMQYGLILEYERIKIQGSDHFGQGQQRICIQKTGEMRYRAVVNVSKC
ncbi:MAG: hypothetical protein V1944_01105 [Candidatus Aenigmatarchaeota archaeon]